ncbi:MAG: hypothetical protein KA807_10975 [Prolixibacteraceae bacterium]|nr:hypothetical protein [Prolixibacteraceae bacterium]
MKPVLRNKISFFLLLLILFSTIGFSVVNTFCADCNHEHAKISLISSEDDYSCNCCSDAETEGHFCQASDINGCKLHHSEKLWVQLKYDSLEVKESLKILYFPITEIINVTAFKIIEADIIKIFTSVTPVIIQTGKTILNKICILRN